MRAKYEIGQEIFYANFTAHRSEHVTCPDCGGTGRLRVTFHDETTVSIPCSRCSRGYEEPTGQIHVYCHKGEAKKATISGINIEGGKIEYSVTRWDRTDDGNTYQARYTVQEDGVFISEVEAAKRGAEMAEEYDRKELEKIFKKEKDRRSWAWNASYHRREIKELERRLEHHRKKLSHAALKAKEPAE